MAVSCTIFCKNNNADLILVFDKLFTKHSRVGNKFSLTGIIGVINVTTMIPELEGGGEFLKLLLGMRTYVKKLYSQDSITLINHIDKTTLAIGVVAEPGFDADERYEELVYAIAKALDGIIFNGHEMIDANGDILAAPSE